MTVSFWCQIEHVDPDHPHRTLVQHSPVFAMEPELRAWVRENKRPGDMIHPWRRENGHDYSLLAKEDIPADPKRLIAELRRLIDSKRHLDRADIRNAIPRRHGTQDATAPMLTYDEVYEAAASEEVEF